MIDIRDGLNQEEEQEVSGQSEYSSGQEEKQPDLYEADQAQPAAQEVPEEEAQDTPEEQPEEEPENDPDSGTEEAEEAEEPSGPEEGEEEAEETDGEDVMDGEWQETGSGIKNFFRKKEKKDKKDQLVEELTDRVRRQMAEFDNFRKRTEKEKTAMYEIGAKSVIEKILPVVDSFERGLQTGADEDDPFVEGMQKIYKQLITTLESMEVKPIEAVGCEFNPNLHNAVMHVEDDTVGENVIVEELQKGYTYRDSVVRYSMVKVAN